MVAIRPSLIEFPADDPERAEGSPFGLPLAPGDD
jgi:hypothetical protein